MFDRNRSTLIELFRNYQKMVLLHIKRGETSQFLYETNVGVEVSKLSLEIVSIYNGCLKIRRVCAGRKMKNSIAFYFSLSLFRNGRTSKLWMYDSPRNDGTD